MIIFCGNGPMPLMLNEKEFESLQKLIDPENKSKWREELKSMMEKFKESKDD